MLAMSSAPDEFLIIAVSVVLVQVNALQRITYLVQMIECSHACLEYAAFAV